MKAKPPKGKPGGSEPTPGATADDLPERWSVQRKMELVLQLLRGEALDAVSRESHSAGARVGALATDLPGAGQARAAHEGRAGGAGADPGPRENRRADDAPGARRGPHRKKGLHGRVEEAQRMKQERSPGTGRRYPLTMICPIYRLAPPSVSATLPRPSRGAAGERGPQNQGGDAGLVGGVPAGPCAGPLHWL